MRMKAQVSSISRSPGVRLRGFSDRGIRSPRPHRPHPRLLRPCLPHRPSRPPTAPGYRPFPTRDGRFAGGHKGLVNRSLLRLVGGTGGNLRPLQLVSSWHRRHRSLHGGRSGRASSYLPAGRAQEGRDRRWNGLDGARHREHQDSGLRCRESTTGSRTAVPARTAASVVPALATRAHAGPAAGSSLSAILSEGARRAVRGSAVSKGSTLPSASASRKAPTGSLRVGALNRDEGQNLRSGETFTTVDVPRAGTQP